MRIGRVSRIAGAAAVVAAVAAGCGSGPTQVGSAVVIGGSAVPLASVQTVIDQALEAKTRLTAAAAQEIQDADIARYVVGREVVHELLVSAAAREGVTVDPAQVDATLAATDDDSLQIDRALLAGEALRSRAEDQLIAIGLAEKYVDRLAVTVDVTSAQSAAEAEQKAHVLAAGGPAAAALLADPRTGQAGAVYRAAVAPEAAASVVFGTPVGQVVSFEPSQGQGLWLVMRIVGRDTNATGGQAAAGTIDRATLAQIGERIAQFQGGPVGLNPRFGVWDPVRLSVSAPGAEAGIVVAPPAG